MAITDVGRVVQVLGPRCSRSGFAGVDGVARRRVCWLRWAARPRFKGGGAARKIDGITGDTMGANTEICEEPWCSCWRWRSVEAPREGVTSVDWRLPGGVTRMILVRRQALGGDEGPVLRPARQ